MKVYLLSGWNTMPKLQKETPTLIRFSHIKIFCPTLIGMNGS